MNIGAGVERRQRLTRFHRLSGRLGNAIATLQKGLAEESYASAVDAEKDTWTSSLPALPEHGFNDPFVQPNATIIIDGQRRILPRDDSFIRRPSTSTMTTASSESDDSKSIESPNLTRSRKKNRRESANLNDRLNSSFNNASMSIKEALEDLASEKGEKDTTTHQPSKSMSDAVFKARAVERARRHMMLSKDDSFINRTDSSKLEPFHFSSALADGAFRRINKNGKQHNQAPAHQMGGIKKWKRPTLAESWDIANTLNIQSMESTRHVGSDMGRNAAA